MDFFYKLRSISIIWKLTVVTALIFVSIIFLTDYLIYTSSKSLLLSNNESQIRDSLERRSEIITNYVDKTKRDVLNLSHSENIQKYVRAYSNNGIDPVTKLSIEEIQNDIEIEFLAVMKSNQYHQVRFIKLDENGQELIRVNGPQGNNGRYEAITRENLQSKSNRDYVQKSRNLLKDEILITGIDLNKEHGKIVVPYEPTQRFIAPVFINWDNTSLQLPEKRLKLIQLTGNLIHLEKILESSIANSLRGASNYWIKKYKDVLPVYHATIDSAFEYSDVKEQDLLLQTQFSHTDINEINENIFDLIKDDKLSHAKRLYESDHYQMKLTKHKNYFKLFTSYYDKIFYLSSPYGILVVNTDAEKIIAELKEVIDYDFIILNEQGGIISHPENNLEWSFEFDSLNTNMLPGLDELFQQGIQYNKDNVIRLTQNDHIHYFKKLFLSETGDSSFIGLVQCASEAEVFATVNGLRNEITVYTIFSIFLILLLSHFILRKITQPIGILKEQADKISSGDRDVKIISKNNDEIGQLGKAFSDLVDKLQMQTKEADKKSEQLKLINESLEDIVEIRTLELEEILRHSEDNQENLKTIFDTNTDALITCDKKGIITRFNKSAERIYGYGEVEIVGKNILDLVPVRFRDGYAKLFSRVFNSNNENNNLTKTYEGFGLKKNGLEFPADLTIAKGGQGEKHFILGIVRDITLKKEMEAEVEKKSRWQKVIHDLLKIGLEKGSLEKQLEQAFDIVLNIPEIKFLGKGAVYLKDTESDNLNLIYEKGFINSLKEKCPLVKMGQCVCGLAAQNREVINSNKLMSSTCINEDNQIKGDAVSIPLLNDNRMLGTMLLSLDPDVKENEEVKIFLEAIGRIFADIISNNQYEEELKQSKIQAETANTLKSEFLATMSHEIRTPMNGILGMTELAMGTELSEEQKEYLSMIKLSGDNLLKIINDILDFSKIEAGHMELEEIAYNLVDETETCIIPLAVQADKKNIDIILDVDSKVPEILLGDPLRMKQVIVNLVSNAIKFTETGYIKIKLGCDSITEDDECLLHVSVEDSGIGIPEEKQSLVFESFTQADSSTTRKYGGTGLGISICQKIVELMGGKLSITSPCNMYDIGGPGTKLYFDIPVKQYYSEMTPVREPFDNTDAEIQIIDSNPAHAEYLKNLIEILGLHVIQDNHISLDKSLVHDLKKAENRLIIYSLDESIQGFNEIVDNLRIIHGYENCRTLILYKPNELSKLNAVTERFYDDKLVKPVFRNTFSDKVLSMILNQEQNKDDVSEEFKNTTKQHKSAEKEYSILVAEDNKVNQILIKKLLAKKNYHVVLAENGLEAIEFYKNNQFDIVLMDVQMPVLGGYEATSSIRSYEKDIGKHTPIIAMTANAMADDKERCLQNGMDDYLSKPINADLLYEYLERYIRQKISDDKFV